MGDGSTIDGIPGRVSTDLHDALYHGTTNYSTLLQAICGYITLLLSNWADLDHKYLVDDQLNTNNTHLSDHQLSKQTRSIKIALAHVIHEITRASRGARPRLPSRVQNQKFSLSIWGNLKQRILIIKHLIDKPTPSYSTLAPVLKWSRL